MFRAISSISRFPNYIPSNMEVTRGLVAKHYGKIECVGKKNIEEQLLTSYRRWKIDD